MTTQINRRVLAVFAILALPLLIVAGLLAFNVGESRLRGVYGQELTHIAELITGATDAYVYRRIIDASTLARIPTIRTAAAEASRRPFEQDKVLEVDKEWQSNRNLPPALIGLLQNEASRFLADLAARDSIYREVLVTDQQGRLIAASNRTSDYYQADEEWWQEAFDDGAHGRIFVSGALYDDSARAKAIHIAAPIINADENRVVGVIKVVADIRELAAIVESMRMGETGSAALVREDGSLVLSRQGDESRFFATDQLREHIGNRQQGAESLYQLHFSARASDGGARLVGVAPSQLSASYPSLNWVGVVSRAESELFDPLQAQASWLLLALALSALVVLVLAVAFSAQLAAPPIADDMHLSTHPAVHRLDEPPSHAESGVRG